MIAALILAHHSPELLSRLVRRLEFYGAQCFIHVDAKVEITPFQAACATANANFIGPRMKVAWGGFSLVEATLSLLSAALPDPQFNHFVLTSGDSYPIKPRDGFRQLVMQPVEQIQLQVIPPQDPMYYRIAKTFLPDTEAPALLHEEHNSALQRSLTEEAFAQFSRVFNMKKAGFPWQYAKGGQWWALTRATAQRCMDIIAHETQLMEWFTYSYVPDEALFQTIMQNFGPFQIRARSPVYTVWDGAAHPLYFTDVADLDRLKNAPAPLARKFSLKRGSALLDLLDEWMDSNDAASAND